MDKEKSILFITNLCAKENNTYTKCRDKTKVRKAWKRGYDRKWRKRAIEKLVPTKK